MNKDISTNTNSNFVSSNNTMSLINNNKSAENSCKELHSAYKS